MAFPKETPWPVVSTKRRLDNADDCQLDVDEFKKPKTVVPVMRKYPPPKIRTGVHFIRDFPPGCGTLHDSLQVERKPLKKLANIDDSNIANNDKTVNSQSSEYTKPKAFGFKKPSSTSNHSSKVKFWDPMQQIVHDSPPVSAITEDKKPSKNQHNINSNLKKTNSIENNRPSYASKPPAKVKFYDPTTDVQISKDANTIDSRKRNKILEVMILFESIYTQLYNENKSKQKGEKIAHWRVPTEAANITKQKLKYLPPTKSLGQIRGVHPGDKFKFRSQLQLTGLHSQPHCGIDYTEINGKKLAISIVDSHRYSNGTGKSCDVISYCGEGGGGGGAMFGFVGSQNRHVADDQKLERGNLALKNSMIEKSPVRVMRKVFGVGNGKEKNDLFVYDGLYLVKKCVQKRGAEGKMVFVFQLHKMDGQNPKKVNGNGFLQRYSTFQMVFDEVCV